MNYLGIDFGTKRIGLALATDETPPVPYGTLQISNFQFPISKIIETIQKERIDVVVVGRPKSMGQIDRKTDIETEAEKFVATLQAQTSVSVTMVDERLSSKGADALQKEYGRSGQRDAVAAMLILESYMSRRLLEIRN